LLAAKISGGNLQKSGIKKTLEARVGIELGSVIGNAQLIDSTFR
jgi:hypothetical protein